MRLVITRIARQVSPYWHDLLIVFALAVGISYASYQGSQIIPVILLASNDVWFEADTTRVYQNMTSRMSNNGRSRVHPLFSLIAYSLVYVSKTALGVIEITAVRIVIAAVAALWISAFFILLRLIGCRKFDAILFSIVAAISAAVMFWFVVPETYSFGSLSILLGLILVAIAQNSRLSLLWYVLTSALTLSITVTNWMVGILMTIIKFPWKQSVQITISAVCLVSVLWGVERVIFPSTVLFGIGRMEAQYILTSRSGGPLQVLKSFIFHPIIMPAIKVMDKHNRPNPPMMILTVQSSFPGSGSLWGAIAAVLWIILLGLGLWGFFSVKKHLQLRIVLGLTLLGQLILHVLYGEETFLFALHFGPLLVVLAAWSTLMRARVFGLMLAGMLSVSAGINNVRQFGEALKLFESYGPPRHQVQVNSVRLNFCMEVELSDASGQYEQSIQLPWPIH